MNMGHCGKSLGLNLSTTRQRLCLDTHNETTRTYQALIFYFIFFIFKDLWKRSSSKQWIVSQPGWNSRTGPKKWISFYLLCYCLSAGWSCLFEPTMWNAQGSIFYTLQHNKSQLWINARPAKIWSVLGQLLPVTWPQCCSGLALKQETVTNSSHLLLTTHCC